MKPYTHFKYNWENKIFIKTNTINWASVVHTSKTTQGTEIKRVADK
jgi:hypothetical protein